MDESDGKWAGLQDSPRQQPVEYYRLTFSAFDLEGKRQTSSNVVLLKLLSPAIAETRPPQTYPFFSFFFFFSNDTKILSE